MTRTRTRKTTNKVSKDETRMSFWDHLEVLRGVLLRSVLYVCVFTCLGLIFKNLLFDVILAPTREDFCVYRMLGWSFGMDLINVEVSAQFFVHLRASAAAGLIFAFPLIVWELWSFISPALYSNEKRPLKRAFVLATLLFYVGVVVAYFIVLPVCLQFFINYSISDQITNSITIGSYMSVFTSTILLIGLAFEFPTLVLALSSLGVLNKSILRKGRKVAFVVILVVAALITPSDPVSMFVLALPLYLLYELSILLCLSPKNLADTV